MKMLINFSESFCGKKIIVMLHWHLMLVQLLNIDYDVPGKKAKPVKIHLLLLITFPWVRHYCLIPIDAKQSESNLLFICQSLHLWDCEISQTTHLPNRLKNTSSTIYSFFPAIMKLFVEVQLSKKRVLCLVWVYISLYFKFRNVLDFPGQFCCYGICHHSLISIVFMGFSVSISSLPFLHGSPYFSYPLVFR